MTNFVTIADFKGNFNIPISTMNEADFEANYTTKYQKEILIKLLGFDLYCAFETGLAVVPTPDAIWTDLKNGSTFTVDSIKYQNPGCKNIIVAYTYCKWLSANFETLTAMGVTNQKTENSDKISPENKITQAWNEMYSEIEKLYSFILENESNYSNWEPTYFQLMTYGF